jgi:3-deoxy-D-manno-octulosonate 8-phosphate phosphatase (KDO 8-P phosphatase)
MPKLKDLKRIKLVLMDVDGVLTNGWLFHFVDTAGELVELKGVHTHDSIALTWLAKHGMKTGLISGRSSRGMQERAKMLGMTHIHQGRLDKLHVFNEICQAEGIGPEQAVYIGDDLPDIPVIRAAGLGVAVANARPEVKKAANWILKTAGGDGAIRELAEIILKAQGHWPGIVKQLSYSH